MRIGHTGPSTVHDRKGKLRSQTTTHEKNGDNEVREPHDRTRSKVNLDGHSLHFAKDRSEGRRIVMTGSSVRSRPIKKAISPEWSVQTGDITLNSLLLEHHP
jgi:hypothetical protein